MEIVDMIRRRKARNMRKTEAGNILRKWNSELKRKRDEEGNQKRKKKVRMTMMMMMKTKKMNGTSQVLKRD